MHLVLTHSDTRLWIWLAPSVAGFYRPQYKFLESVDLAPFLGAILETFCLFLQTIPLHGVMFHCGVLNLPGLEA